MINVGGPRNITYCRVSRNFFLPRRSRFLRVIRRSPILAGCRWLPRLIAACRRHWRAPVCEGFRFVRALLDRSLASRRERVFNSHSMTELLLLGLLKCAVAEQVGVTFKIKAFGLRSRIKVANAPRLSEGRPQIDWIAICCRNLHMQEVFNATGPSKTLGSLKSAQLVAEVAAPRVPTPLSSEHGKPGPPASAHSPVAVKSGDD